jgi:hypothetical protein
MRKSDALSLLTYLLHRCRDLCPCQVDRVRTENLETSQPNELFLFDISHPYGPTGHRSGDPPWHAIHTAGLVEGCLAWV